MLLQLEQECLDIYRRKVENTRKYRATLHQSLAEAEFEINNIVSALGEHASFSRVCAFRLFCFNCVFSKIENEYCFSFTFFGQLVNLVCILNFSFSMLFGKFEKGKGTLKDQISAIKPILEELRLRKKQRVKEFSEIQSQIACICAEIAGNGQSKNYGDPEVNEHDLTAKRLAELNLHLKELQSEKVQLVNFEYCGSSIKFVVVVLMFSYFHTGFALAESC